MPSSTIRTVALAVNTIDPSAVPRDTKHRRVALLDSAPSMRTEGQGTRQPLLVDLWNCIINGNALRASIQA